MEFERGPGKLGRREVVMNREGVLCGIAIYLSIPESSLGLKQEFSTHQLHLVVFPFFFFFVILNLFIFIFYQYTHVSEI